MKGEKNRPTTVLRVGKRHDQKSCGKNGSPKRRWSLRTEDAVMIFGLLVVAAFFLSPILQTPFFPRKSGEPMGLSADAARLEEVFLPVMSYTVEEEPEPEGIRERIRKNVRSASGEAEGYLNGQWNLWEYIGDVMADLLVG